MIGPPYLALTKLWIICSHCPIVLHRIRPLVFWYIIPAVSDVISTGNFVLEGNHRVDCNFVWNHTLSISSLVYTWIPATLVCSQFLFKPFHSALSKATELHSSETGRVADKSIRMIGLLQFDYASSSCSLIDLALICCRSSNTSFIVWFQLNILLVLLESDILQESPKLVAFSDVQHSVNFQGLSDAFEPCLCWWCHDQFSSLPELLSSTGNHF